MTSISATSTSTPTVTGKDGTSFSTGTDRTAMDTNTFLKLLTAQLKYQDPSNPTDSSQFMAETAQFTAVEKQVQLADLTQKVLNASLTQTAASLVGKTVGYTDASGTARTGVVSSASLQSSTPNLTINGVQVALDKVTSVTSDAAGTTTSV